MLIADASSHSASTKSSLKSWEDCEAKLKQKCQPWKRQGNIAIGDEIIKVTRGWVHLGCLRHHVKGTRKHQMKMSKEAKKASTQVTKETTDGPEGKPKKELIPGTQEPRMGRQQNNHANVLDMSIQILRRDETLKYLGREIGF